MKETCRRALQRSRQKTFAKKARRKSLQRRPVENFCKKSAGELLNTKTFNDFLATEEGQQMLQSLSDAVKGLVESFTTDNFNSLVEKGWDIKYLPLAFLPEEWPDDCAVRGVVSLPRKLFKDYRIGIGTRVMAFGTAIEMWSSEEAKKHQPLAVRTGIISARQDFPTQWPGVASTAPIMVECNTLPGFSGGPVFAEIKNGMLTYPAFIGVSSCMITRGHVPLDTNPGLPNLSGFSLVSALDELVKQDAGTNLPTNGATSARTASPIESPDSE